jgi:type II secretory pathway pseudopilin PulG
MIALLIFAIGIAAAIQTLPNSNTATTRARNLTIATNLAQEKIEELIGLPFNSADLNSGNHADPRNPLERIFTRTWNVADNVPLVDMKQVTVTVSFESGSNDNSVTLDTYITSRR